MAFEIVKVDGAVLHVRIQGVMTLADHQAMQEIAKKLIAQGLKPRVLVTTVGFQGWEKGADWSNVSFLSDYGDDIVKMAIVGDLKWKDQVFMFVARGLRKTAVEYFTSGATEQAEAWVRA